MRKWVYATAMIFSFMAVTSAKAQNLVQNGSFEGVTGVAPSSWSVGGVATDGYYPVAIMFNQGSNYPNGAQGEAVPTDNATSLSPDVAGSNAVYFVSDEAKNLSLYQSVYLTPGSYDIGFDSYATFNGSQQPHDSVLSASIAGIQLANFDLAGVVPGTWISHSGKAQIVTAGEYLVEFIFNTPDTPANPDPTNPNGEYNAKDVLIDRAYVVSDSTPGGIPIPAGAVPEPAVWAMMVGGFGLIGGMARYRRRKVYAAQL